MAVSADGITYLDRIYYYLLDCKEHFEEIFSFEDNLSHSVKTLVIERFKGPLKDKTIREIRAMFAAITSCDIKYLDNEQIEGF